MLVWIRDTNWTLINMKDGKRWVDPSLIADASREEGLTAEQLRSYIIGDYFWSRFTPVRVSIREVK
jgi:hypothetical protein